MAHELEVTAGEAAPETLVITYRSPRGRAVVLTTRQACTLDRLGLWLRDSAGGEYCTVAYGPHWGRPTWSADEFSVILAGLERGANGSMAPTLSRS